MIRALRCGLNLQAIDRDPVAQNSWSLFSDRYDVLQGLPAVSSRTVNILIVSRTILFFFFTDQSTDPSALLASDHLRLYLARLLQKGDIDQFLILAKDDPNKFYQVLQTSATTLRTAICKIS